MSVPPPTIPPACRRRHRARSVGAARAERTGDHRRSRPSWSSRRRAVPVLPPPEFVCRRRRRCRRSTPEPAPSSPPVSATAIAATIAAVAAGTAATAVAATGDASASASASTIAATDDDDGHRRRHVTQAAGAVRALQRTLAVALLRLRGDLGEAVRIVGIGRIERGVVAVRDVDVLDDGTRDLADLLERGAHQRDRHRRVPQRRRSLLGLTHGVVREHAQRVALVLVEVAEDRGRQDEVRVRRQRVVARIGVVVDAVEHLGEVGRRVALVAIDVRLQQRHRDVLGCRLRVEAGRVEDLDHGGAVEQRVRVVDVPDRAFRLGPDHTGDHTGVADLTDHPLVRGVVGRHAALRRTARSLAEVVPDARVLGDHPPS